MIHKYDDELDTIPMDGACTIILDVSELKFASTRFLHKLIDVKENVVLANLHGQPKQAFVICGLDGIIKTFNSTKEAEIFLKN
jgi:anti-anti-sigma regulatory factor